MNIKLDKNLSLKRYSKDLIEIKKGNKTLVSYTNIIGALNWLDKNGYKGVKNRVQPLLIDLTSIYIDECLDSFETDNYKVSFDGKREFTVQDKSSRNNIRWIYFKSKMIEKVYHLEINRLDVSSLDELEIGIKEVNVKFEQIIKNDNQDNAQKCSKRIRYFDNNGKEISTQVYSSTEADKVVNFAHEIVKSVFNTKAINKSLYCINQENKKCC